jgi:hypothetical protein
MPCFYWCPILFGHPIVTIHSAVYIKNKVTLFLEPHCQAPITPFDRYLESNEKVQWRPPRPGPPLNILIALQISVKVSYGSLTVGLQKQSYFVLDIHSFQTQLHLSRFLSTKVNICKFKTVMPPMCKTYST